MAGNPGTPHFGDYPDVADKAGANGRSPLDLQSDSEPFQEQHRLFNPALQARDPGTPPGSFTPYAPDGGSGYNAACNHDGFDGGDHHLTSLDELKVLDQVPYRVKIEMPDEKISGSTERS